MMALVTWLEKQMVKLQLFSVGILKHYVHCAAHTLNLCIAQTNSLTGVISLFDTVTSIANFFNYSPNIQKALESKVESLSIEIPSFCNFVERGGWRGSMH